TAPSAIEVRAETAIELVAGDQGAEFLMLQGRPIAEPVAQHGPFVMNTQAEIMQAMQDYRRTQFGGWRWDDPAPVHGGEAKRFALAVSGNPAWAAAAVQDAFVQIAEKPRGYDREQGPLRAYLCGIARYKLLARWRESSGVDPIDEEAHDAPHTHTPEADIARSQDTQA